MTNRPHKSSATATSRLPAVMRALILLMVLGTLPACYTILKHPTVILEDYTRAETQRCSDCHYESDLWHFHHPQRPYHPGYGFRNPWTYYYDVPWWYDSYWFYDDPGDPETVPLHRRSLRPGDDKDPSIKSPGTNIAPPPASKPGDSNVKTRIKTKEDSDDEKENADKDQKRSVRPVKKKKKDN